MSSTRNMSTISTTSASFYGILLVLILLSSSLQIVMANEQEEEFCKYDILIDNKSMIVDKCYPSPASYQITGQYKHNVVVWNPNVSCASYSKHNNNNNDNKKMMYVHSSGLPERVYPMTAGSGPYIHTYYAAAFDVLPIPAGFYGTCVEGFDPELLQDQQHCTKTFRIARNPNLCQ
mmetsp:Transcript_12670/g.18203  ORF Transcript_12670/g.18203 Transcript_12670/m.18203 type:complete len:176 (-) Transcript_12670:56-583(-)